MGGFMCFLARISLYFLAIKRMKHYGELNKHLWDRLWSSSGQLPGKAKYSWYGWTHLTISRPLKLGWLLIG